MDHSDKTAITQDQLQPYFNKVYQHGDALTKSFILGFFVLGVILSFFYNTYLLAFLMGGISLALYFGVQTIAPQSLLLRLVASLIYWNFGLQFIVQMNGLYQMHFTLFIALTVLLFYEDRRVFLPATIYAILTLVILYLKKDSDFVKTYFDGSIEISLTAFLVHLTFILFYTGLCSRWAMLQRAQTKESAIRAILMEQQLSMMEANIDFANNISQGNLKSEYPVENADQLGQSLLNMRENLVKSSQREEQERFATTGLARTGEILRQHADNLNELCDQVIEELEKYMKANQGSVFVLEGHGTSQEHLSLMACRAWNRKKFLQKKINLGEGLVGQSAIEKRTIFLTKVPPNYITISSGLGEANPNCILIVPLKSEDQIVGAIELASFKVYQDFEIKFLEKVSESIASTIITTRNNQRNKELLEKSNLLAEQMRSQEEEIRQNMEEMTATQEEMQRKNREIERLLAQSNEKEQILNEKIKEVESIKLEDETKNKQMMAYMKNYRQTLLNILDQLPHKIFLKDHEGKMVLVNTAVAKAQNVSIDELIGKSDFDFVDAETAQQWRNQELEIIKKGSETYVMSDSLGGKPVSWKTTKMAFFIPHMNQTGLLGIQTDISELQQLKDQAEARNK